jgi:hypothetical protein
MVVVAERMVALIHDASLFRRDQPPQGQPVDVKSRKRAYCGRIRPVPPLVPPANGPCLLTSLTVTSHAEAPVTTVPVCIPGVPTAKETD